MHDLAVQITKFDDISVDEAETTDTRAGEVESGGGAEAAEADNQDGGCGETVLTGEADVGDQKLSCVARGSEGWWGDEGGVGTGRRRWKLRLKLSRNCGCALCSRGAA